eukprot:1157225-Pelagomonas_calceolata.AAC.2
MASAMGKDIFSISAGQLGKTARPALQCRMCKCRLRAFDAKHVYSGSHILLFPSSSHLGRFGAAGYDPLP